MKNELIGRIEMAAQQQVDELLAICDPAAAVPGLPDLDLAAVWT